MYARLIAGVAATLVLFAILPHRPSHATGVADGLGQTEPGPYVLTVSVDRITPQQPTGIQGSVVDLAGEPIAGASIAYVGPGADVERAVAAGPDGVFQIAGIEPGPWVLNVTAKGYTTRHALSVTVIAGTMSPTDVRMRKRPSYSSQLIRVGAAHAWVAAILSTGLLLWAYHGRRVSPAESLPKRGVTIAVGVVAGTILGYSLAILADTFVHHIGREALTPTPRRPDLWWARNTATQLISAVGGSTGAILGVAAGLGARQGRSVAQCALGTAIGGVAAGAAVALSKAPSSAFMMLRMLDMLDEPTSAQMWVVYLAIGSVGSALVGAIVGLCVSSAVVGLTRRRVRVAAS